MGEPERHRPPVSLIVPFAGSDDELMALRRRLDAIKRRQGDELIVSDNRRHQLHTPAFARNEAARTATGEWLVFIDADTVPDTSLLDSYFEPAPEAETAILAGAIVDQAPPGAGLIARYIVDRAQMSDRQTIARTGMPYAQTANCAVRRSAFESVGGFDAHARAGEDADLCFRLSRVGWKLEQRPAAVVAHFPRATLSAWLTQLAIHGSGAAWLERRWPGEFPRSSVHRFFARLARHAAAAVGAATRGDTERAAFALLDIAGACAFAFGRVIPNKRELTG